MKAIPIGQVWGGLITYNSTQIPAALKAIASFSTTNTDPKAQIVAAFIGVNGTTSISLLTFYNGATPGSALKTILALPAAASDCQTSSLLANVLRVSVPYANAARQRVVFGSPRIQTLSTNILNAVEQQIAVSGWFLNGCQLW